MVPRGGRAGVCEGRPVGSFRRWGVCITAWLAVSSVAFSGHGASAQPIFGLPWSSEPGRYDAANDRVEAAALALPRDVDGRLEAVVLSSRRRAVQRAKRMLHAFVDAQLEDVHADPWTASRLHAVVRQHAKVIGIRPLVDGASVAKLVVPARVLRRVSGIEGVAWASGR